MRSPRDDAAGRHGQRASPREIVLSRGNEALEQFRADCCRRCHRRDSSLGGEQPRSCQTVSSHRERDQPAAAGVVGPITGFQAEGGRSSGAGRGARGGDGPPRRLPLFTFNILSQPIHVKAKRPQPRTQQKHIICWSGDNERPNGYAMSRRPDRAKRGRVRPDPSRCWAVQDLRDGGGTVLVRRERDGGVDGLRT